MAFWSTEIETHLPVAVAMERIRTLVGLPRPTVLDRLVGGFEEPKEERPFEGHVAQESFKVKRVIHYKNSFLPMIEGRIRSAPNGAVVHLRLRTYGLSLAFLLLWFGGCGFALFAARGEQLFGILAMLAMGALILGGGFGIEAMIALSMLRKALQ